MKSVGLLFSHSLSDFKLNPSDALIRSLALCKLCLPSEDKLLFCEDSSHGDLAFLSTQSFLLSGHQAGTAENSGVGENYRIP